MHSPSKHWPLGLDLVGIRDTSISGNKRVDRHRAGRCGNGEAAKLRQSCGTKLFSVHHYVEVSQREPPWRHKKTPACLLPPLVGGRRRNTHRLAVTSTYAIAKCCWSKFGIWGMCVGVQENMREGLYRCSCEDNFKCFARVARRGLAAHVCAELVGGVCLRRV